MVLGTVCSNLLSTFDLMKKKCQFYAFNESTDNSQVTSTALHALCSDTCWSLRHTSIDTLLQFKTNKIYLEMKSVKLLLVLSIGYDKKQKHFLEGKAC